MAKRMLVNGDEIVDLIKGTEDQMGERGAVHFSFGPSGVWIDEEKQPHKAKQVRDFRDDNSGVRVSDGAGI